jgi:hypothetical protein
MVAAVAFKVKPPKKATMKRGWLTSVSEYVSISKSSGQRKHGHDSEVVEGNDKVQRFMAIVRNEYTRTQPNSRLQF